MIESRLVVFQRSEGKAASQHCASMATGSASSSGGVSLSGQALAPRTETALAMVVGGGPSEEWLVYAGVSTVGVAMGLNEGHVSNTLKS